MAVRQITEAVVRLVNILKRDESAETTRQLPHSDGADKDGAGDLEGEIDVGAEAPPGEGDEEDDEDMIIEEI